MSGLEGSRGARPAPRYHSGTFGRAGERFREIDRGSRTNDSVRMIALRNLLLLALALDTGLSGLSKAQLADRRRSHTWAAITPDPPPNSESYCVLNH